MEEELLELLQKLEWIGQADFQLFTVPCCPVCRQLKENTRVNAGQTIRGGLHTEACSLANMLVEVSKRSRARASGYFVIVQHFGQYELPLQTSLAIAFAVWTEIDDFCPLCEAHPSSGHTLECPLVQQELNGRAVTELPSREVIE